PTSTLFPYTTLFRSRAEIQIGGSDELSLFVGILQDDLALPIVNPGSADQPSYRLANKVISLKTGRKTVSTKNRLPATGSKMIEGTVVRAYPDGPTLHIGCTGHRPDRLKILAVLAFQFQRAVFRVLLKTPGGDLPSCQ